MELSNSVKEDIAVAVTGDAKNASGFQKPLPPVPQRPTPGRIVSYFMNDPNGQEDALIAYPAMIVRVNEQTLAATLQVFMETHVAPYTRVPFAETAKELGAGKYAFPVRT